MFHRVLAGVLLAVLWTASARASLTHFPLKVGPTGRTLVDQTGQPFLLVGDAAWSLIAVNLASVAAGPATAWWVDPATGAATAAGSFAASGTKTFTPPAGGADWVFVLDSAGRGFGAPGASSLPVPATPRWPMALLVVGLLYAMTLRTKDAN